MKFIKVTRYHNNACIYLASNKIESIETSATSDHVTKFSSDSPTTTIIMDSKDIFEVKETPKEIFKLLEDHEDDDGINLSLLSGEDANALNEILFKPRSSYYMKIEDIIEEYKHEKYMNQPDPDYVKKELNSHD